MDRDPTDHKPKRRRVDEGYDVSPLIASIEDTQQSYSQSNGYWETREYSQSFSTAYNSIACSTPQTARHLIIERSQDSALNQCQIPLQPGPAFDPFWNSLQVDPFRSVETEELVQTPQHSNQATIQYGMRAGTQPSCDVLAPCQTWVEERVCFGMIQNIAGRCFQSQSFSIPRLFDVDIDSSNHFVSKDRSCDIQGRIISEHEQMIQGLLDEKSLDLQVFCAVEESPTSNKPDRAFTQCPCSLSIVVFGALDLLEEIGSWLQEYDVYLQDPVNVSEQYSGLRYCNPHRLSFEQPGSCSLVREVSAQNSRLLGFQEIGNQPDLLDLLSNHAHLEEAPQPTATRTSLKKHQRQALTFMMKREKGWAFREDGDIWEVRDASRGLQSRRLSEGIMADLMGFGKTLTMISLAATDIDVPQHPWYHSSLNGLDGKEPVPATLIIIPPPLLGTWQEQISDHMFGSTFRFRLHYGKNRLLNVRDTHEVNVVLTTYHTVSAEWKKQESKNDSVLFSLHWRRIILDEAHFIRNDHSQISRAVCDLAATSRWAVTGTPIQNRLDDLASLLKFIRAYPYHDLKQSKADISNPWKSGDDEKGIQRLKYLSASLVLRRPKTTISLPCRRDLKYPVEFSRQEREAYEAIRGQAIMNIDEALQSGSDPSKGVAYVNVLQQIESLRLFCNLGLHYYIRHDLSKRLNDSWEAVAQQTFNAQREMDPVSCLHCSSSLEVTESLLDPVDGKGEGKFFRCMQFCCGECVGKIQRSRAEVACSHSPPCPGATVTLIGQAVEEIASLQTLHPRTGLDLPSKIQALVTDIKCLPKETKCVVFSAWRLTLDLVEAGLRQCSVGNIRFDGKVPQKERQGVVHRFKTDPSIQVMLLTLSCGAVGLTLIAASRAYLIEPHWNPNLEEQALARVHRLGQTREVTTIRFYIRDSFEKQIMELQATKKQLAGVLLAPHDGEGPDDKLGALHKLRSLL